MATLTHAPNGWSTVTPRVVCSDTLSLLDFLKAVFRAETTYEPDRPSLARIGDSQIMVSTTDERPLVSAFLYVYVQNADDIFQRALDSGATPLEEPLDTHYGERRCMFEDHWGNTWQVANLL